MLTDEAIDALAEEIFDVVLAELREESTIYFYDVTERKALLYGKPGIFRCSVLALPIIKHVIRRSEALLNRYGVVRERDEALNTIGTITATHLAWSLGWRINLTIEQAASDCLLFAESMIRGAPEVAIRDVRPLIADAVGKAAEARRNLLLAYVQGLPNLKASGPGRPVVTSFARAVERRQYSEQIRNAYQALLTRLGRKPTKTEVAEEVGAGGINPQTGSDTRLNTFNNKLRRLKIDYAAIVRDVDSTL